MDDVFRSASLQQPVELAAKVGCIAERPITLQVVAIGPVLRPGDVAGDGVQRFIASEKSVPCSCIEKKGPLGFKVGANVLIVCDAFQARAGGEASWCPVARLADLERQARMPPLAPSPI